VRDARRPANNFVYQAKTAAVAYLKVARQVLNLVVDPTIPTYTPFGAVQEKAFTLRSREQFAAVPHYMPGAGFDEAGFEWARHVRMFQAFKLIFRHLFAALDFAGQCQTRRY
jgi:hypothetical protein